MPATETPIEFVSRPEVSAAAVDYARLKVNRAIGVSGQPVLRARVTMRVAPDPAVERPCTVDVHLDLGGRKVRTHVTARSLREGIDLAEGRLRDRLEHLAGRERARRRAAPNGRAAARRAEVPQPDHAIRRADDRRLVRRMTLVPGVVAAEEAVIDLRSLGHDFVLFRDVATGRESLVERDENGQHHLRRIGPAETRTDPAAGIRVGTSPVPRLNLQQGLQRLEDGGEHRVFFEDAVSGLGRVVYWRHDGNFGLIEPSRENPAGVAGALEQCPECSAPGLDSVTGGELTNFLCLTCGACWHIELGWVHRIEPATCPGCPSKPLCDATSPAGDQSTASVT